MASSSRNTRTWDVAILGSGPAGLSAAIYLARFNRRTLVVEGEGGQTSWSQVTKNYLGFPRGIKARDLIARGREQAKQFGAVIQRGPIDKIVRTGTGFALHGQTRFRASAIVFCTGTSTSFPAFPGRDRYIGRSLFDCLICHGHAVRGQRVLVVGHDDASAPTCLQLLRFTRHLTFLINCDSGGDKLSGAAKERLERGRIPVKCGALKSVRGRGGMMREVELDTGEIVKADFMFSRQTRIPNADLAASLGIVIEGEGHIKVDAHQRTSMERVYAAGDVCSTSRHQIISAAHQGAAAAMSVHEDLASDIEKPW